MSGSDPAGCIECRARLVLYDAYLRFFYAFRTAIRSIKVARAYARQAVVHKRWIVIRVCYPPLSSSTTFSEQTDYSEFIRVG